MENLTNKLDAAIQEAEHNGADLNAASWGMQEGILLTANEAKAVLAALEELHGFSKRGLVSGPVRVLKTPVSERYCREGDEAVLDLERGQIRRGGAWFIFNPKKWKVEPITKTT